MTDIERRALIALFRNHPQTAPNQRYGWDTPMLAAERRELLLAWSATLTDGQLLRMRNFGPASLNWVRGAADEHHVHRCECACGMVASDPRETLREVRRWVGSIGATNLATGRRITKADALLVLDAALQPPDPGAEP
jgi:hypothetical protein